MEQNKYKNSDNFKSINSSKSHRLLYRTCNYLTNKVFNSRLMNRNTLLACFFCFLLTGPSVSSVAVANSVQQPVDRTVSEPAKANAQKSRAVTKPVSGKVASSKSTATAKATDKPGKRFWGRIMGVFRDVHSAEKRPNK
ncbi:hypothetical protein [Fibrella arboris]|uniref:hypothetical protein n=1 Tax=Fibrella arboris TaxID=3242486 RepID=UPI0035220139